MGTVASGIPGQRHLHICRVTLPCVFETPL
ncbi:MAG: hypothetical protein BWX50_01273 [Euryarchaeota archaeon ADurb.Bin009]|nr:MAG: hypothetical protein BWX50_01273 [Euryarchaeota archaeon ADurb.Bin009]